MLKSCSIWLIGRLFIEQSMERAKSSMTKATAKSQLSMNISLFIYTFISCRIRIIMASRPYKNRKRKIYSARHDRRIINRETESDYCDLLLLQNEGMSTCSHQLTVQNDRYVYIYIYTGCPKCVGTPKYFGK